MKNHIVCIASEFKGNEFFEECAVAGWNVTLVTREKLRDEAWTWTSLNAIKIVSNHATTEDYVRAVVNVADSQPISSVVGIDEFDVLTAAKTREHLQLKGMSNSHALRFRDKLRMRNVALEAKIACPEFSALFNQKEIKEYLETSAPPWIIKPRTEVSAFGIRKCACKEQVWQVLHELDARNTWRDHPSQFLIEEFIEGKVFHVDSVVERGKIIASGVSQYGTAPLEVAHQGGVFTTATLPYESKERKELERLNKKLLKGFGYDRGVSHAEFLQSERNGKFYLLEVAARVGGAYIANVLEAASGLNLWREWARLETATEGKPYQLPKLRRNHAGLALALAKDEKPDTSAYTDKEIYYRVAKLRHVGLIFQSEKHERVQELLNQYTQKFTVDFLDSAPTRERHDDF